MPHLFVQPREVPLSLLGTIVPNAVAYFYDAQTATPRATFTDATLAVNHPFPVPANNVGVLPPIYLDQAGGPYKVDIRTFVLANPLSVSLPRYPVDNIEVAPAVIEPQTQTEEDLGVVPTFYTYRTSPKRDVRRHLTSNWDNGGLQTTGLQTAMNVTYAEQGRLILPNGLDITSGGTALVMNGNRATQGFAIEGPGWNGARITQVDTPAALISIAGATPAFNPSEAPLVMEGFSLQGLGNAAHGIRLNGIGYWRLSNVQARGFNAAFNLKSALLGSINDNCMGNESVYGLLAQRDGALPYPAGGSGCNRLTVEDSFFNLNSTFGVYLQSGGNWALSNLDIEGNGTIGNVNTGGIRLTSELDDDIGYAQVACRNLWMEANKGTPFLVDACSGLTLSIADSLLLNSGEGTMELWVVGADRVSIADTMSPAGGGGIWQISANYLTLKNTICGTLTDSGVTYPSYRNASTATAAYVTGKTDNFTVTLTGVSGSVTGSAFSHKDGDRVTIALPTLVGTSNATTLTVTGIPAYLRPLANRAGGVVQIRDNSVDSAATSSISTGGVITLSRMDSAAFTASANKGVLGGAISYRITA